MRTHLAVVFAAIVAGCSSNGSPKAQPPAGQTPSAAEIEPTVAASDPEAERAALVAAGLAYVDAEAAQGLEVDIDVHAIEGDYALLLVTPHSDEADTGLALMKRDGKTWTGLLLDTAVDCDMLLELGAPEPLCNML